MSMSKSQQKTAVVLVSGGLDSATVLAMAVAQGYQCYALSLDYGQRHRLELDCAKQVSHANGAVEHRIVSIGMGSFGGSALTDNNIDVPAATDGDAGIPVTYVPARNTVFLSIALGWAEVLNASAIFIGANAVDYSGYPDCRPDYINAFQRMANLATKAGIEALAESRNAIEIKTPLIDLSKAQIIQTGLDLGVDYGQTLSCYNPSEQGTACHVCDSCRIRANGFQAVGQVDPAQC